MLFSRHEILRTIANCAESFRLLDEDKYFTCGTATLIVRCLNKKTLGTVAMIKTKIDPLIALS